VLAAVREFLAIQGVDFAEVIAPELEVVEGVAVLGLEIVVLDEPGKECERNSGTGTRCTYLLLGWSEARKPLPL
jgi:hypothetical protein